jgi:hypothetical protein
MIRKRIALAGLVALLLFLLAGAAWAGSSANYAVDWSVLSGGGAPASGGAVALNGTLGQTSIGPSTSAQVDLSAGYWYGLGKEDNWIYLPIIVQY